MAGYVTTYYENKRYFNLYCILFGIVWPLTLIVICARKYLAYQIHKEIKHLQPTSSDIEGPFYKSGAPIRDKLAENINLKLSGKVYNTCGQLLSNVLLDFWQADELGNYDNEGFNYRGKVISDNDGNYHVDTIIPGDYQIGEDEFRCSHIHVKLIADGHKPLTTQLYFANDKFNSTDHWFDPKRIISENGQEGKFDFILSHV